MPESLSVDVVDTHIHSRQKPTGVKKYDFDASHVFSDLEHGGVMVAHEMPNTTPPLTTYAEIKSRIEELKHISNYGGLYFCYNGKNINELKSCIGDPEVRKYIVGVKIYPATHAAGSVTTSGGAEQDMYDFSLEEDSELDQIGKFCSEQNLSITIHCEDPVEKNKIRTKYGTFDDDTEPKFVRNTVIPLCEKYPQLKFIVAHVSNKDTVETLEDAWRAKIKNIFVEITPHHLLLSTTEIQEILDKDAIFGFCHPFVKINGNHKYAIQQLLLDGKHQDQILYGSDHAPHSEEAKRRGMGGIPNHQGPQILLAWFRARGFTMNDPIVKKFFGGNAQKAFNGVPEWTEHFKQRAGSILFTPSDFQEGVSIPNRIHNNVVMNPWGKLMPENLKEYWVVPSKK